HDSPLLLQASFVRKRGKFRLSNEYPGKIRIIFLIDLSTHIDRRNLHAALDFSITSSGHEFHRNDRPFIGPGIINYPARAEILHNSSLECSGVGVITVDSIAA